MAFSLTCGPICASGSATRSAPRLQFSPATQQRTVPSFCGLKALGCKSSSYRTCTTALNSQQSNVARAARGGSNPIECKSQFKVALLGAAGGIGQPTALLLKMNRYISDLSLYDIVNVPGVAADLSHCNTPCQVGLNKNSLMLKCL